jgi:hypothetical protein
MPTQYEFSERLVVGWSMKMVFILCVHTVHSWIISRNMVWEGYVACMEGMRNAHRNLVQKLKWLVESRGPDSSAAQHGPVAGEHSNEHWGLIKGGFSWLALQEGVWSLALMKQNIIQINNVDSAWHLCQCTVIISFRVWRNAHWASKVASDEGFAFICYE